VAAVIKTEKKTPTLSRWLNDLLAFVAQNAPEGSSERVSIGKAAADIKLALDGYMEHRKSSDPKRLSSHQELYRALTMWCRRLWLSAIRKC